MSKFPESKTSLTGYPMLAVRLEEASKSDLTSRDVVNRLSGAVDDHHRGTGEYASYLDHFGDSESGDVIYNVGRAVKRAPYSIGGGDSGASAKASVDFDGAEEVVPRTIYETPADEDEHYAHMSEALVRDGLYASLPVYERFVSKGERDKADEGDFAGKGKSFPILKPEDVQAAVHAMGRAGSGNLGPSGIKARIIAIAKRKGWTKYLPQAWQGDGEKESAAAARDGLRLVEAAIPIDAIVLREARTDYEIKLIAPGKGASAFYPAEVLKRDGPKVFRSGTHVYLNHPTAAEEAARPENDVANLAGVLTTEAYYSDSHAKGPGLYARMKIFADHAQTVEEKAAHIGMSIRARGNAESGKQKDGLPVLKELTGAESVDVVTRAGAGGMILTEAAIAAKTQGGAADMTEAEVQKLVEAATAPLRERALRGDAQIEAARLLKTITLPEAAKQRVIDTVLAESLPKTAAGELDKVKLAEAVNSRAKEEGSYLGSALGFGVVGMGTAPASIGGAPLVATRTPEIVAKESADIFSRLAGGDRKVGEAAARKGRSA